MEHTRTCINCGRTLVKNGDIFLCPDCNTSSFVHQPFLSFETTESDDFIYIECPGASLYEPGTTEVIQGVVFDDDEKNCQYRIIGRPVFAPTHTKRRKIKRDALGKIRRCQGCQDYTIRMRRREGPDFFIPSRKHPGRRKLKSVTTA